MTTIRNDIELSKGFGEVLADEYNAALNFIHIDASASLLKFRNIAEILCELISNSKNIDLSSKDLYPRIEELCDYQIINHPTYDRLHRLRVLGNIGAHPDMTLLNGDETDKIAIQKMNVQYAEELREKAFIARELTVRNMEDAHSIIFNRPLPISVNILPISDNSWHKEVNDAILSPCYKKKLQAGRIYDSLANEMRIKDPFSQSHDHEQRYRGLKKQAVCNYELAYILSAKVDNEFISSLMNGKSISLENIYKNKSDPEALYRFWYISVFQDETQDFEWMLEASAKRGWPEAQANYGGLLLDLGMYEDALAMLELALEAKVDLAYKNLFQFYVNEKQGNLDLDKALDYLYKGVELNGAECTYILGKLHHKRIREVDPSESKGKELILKAIQLGSTDAEDYYFNDVLEVKQKFRAELEENLTKVLGSLNRKAIPDKKVGMNDLCPCGSGKKYKKCCRIKGQNTEYELKDSIKRLIPD